MSNNFQENIGGTLLATTLTQALGLFDFSPEISLVSVLALELFRYSGVSNKHF